METIFGNEVKIVINPGFEVGSNAFAHEGGHIYGAAISPSDYFRAKLPKDFKSCQSSSLRNHAKVKTATDWQDSYDSKKKK